MRKYKKNKLTAVICNCCGKNLAVENEIIKEGASRIYARWDYFSNKDGQNHSFDICEECYDEVTSHFAIPVNVDYDTELI